VASGDSLGAQAPNRSNRPVSQPAPRDADGHVVLGNTATLKGVWIGGNLGFCNSNTVAAPASLNPGATGGPGGAARAGGPGFGGGRGAAAGPCTPVPYMEWTRGVSDDRRRNELEPHTRCKPSGGPRQWLTPYGAEFLELREQKVAYIFDIGGPHTFRTIYMDGRSHPENLSPTNYGHSVGWWEKDTLVVDTIGYSEDFWLDRRGLPHTEQLHTIERFTRTNKDTIDYKIIIDDPATYTKPYEGGFNLGYDETTELFEYVCQQANYAHELMVGGESRTISRSSTIIP